MPKKTRIAIFYALFISSLSIFANPQFEADSIGQNQKTYTNPIKWFIKNWAAKDSAYCRPSPYSGGIELQDRMSQEYITFESEGCSFVTSSKVANRIGPYFGYGGAFAGSTFNVFAKKAPNRSELTAYVNSQLFNIELTYRRTGGDFSMDKFTIDTGNNHIVDMTNELDLSDNRIGDFFSNNLTGISINYFFNHKRYSNPAGFTRGTVQMRSAGSFSLGARFAHQKMHFDFYDDNDITTLLDVAENVYECPGPSYGTNFLAMLGSEEDVQATYFTTLAFTRSPSQMKVNDLSIQTGYAYNWVIVPNLLFSAHAIVAPGMKWLNYYSRGTIAYDICSSEGTMHAFDEPLSQSLQERHIDFDPDHILEGNFGPVARQDLVLDVNFYGRASITYRHGNWRIGSRFLYSAYSCKSGDTLLRDRYWDVRFVVGFDFGKLRAADLIKKKKTNL